MTHTVHENEAASSLDPQPSALEFKKLVSGCGIAELAGRAQVRLSGKDRTRWLNGMMTNNIRDLAVGHGVYGFLLNPQGQIQGDLYAYNGSDYLLIETDRIQLETILKLFRRYIIMDKVEITELSDVMLQITGPKAAEILTATGFQLPDLQPLQFAELKWNNLICTIARQDVPCVPSFEIWCSASDGKVIHEGLRKAGAAAVDAGALELLRIACGIPRFGQDIQERNLPQETEQARALNFNKGCYIGQEIVERIRSRGNVHRKFTGFLIDEALPALGTALQIEGKSVGEITSTASLPFGEGFQNVALGYLRREFAAPGNKIPIENADAIVASLPFTNFFQQ
ncbi:MAG TPA: folate-binding protein [Terriglobales bacterium]|jgi:aminomethyltransferase